MRICLSSLWFNRFSGAGRYTVELAEHLCREHDVHVVTTNLGYEAPRVPDIVIHKIPPIPNVIVHRIPHILSLPMAATFLAYNIWTSRYIGKINREIGFDVIHTSSLIYPHDVATVHGCFSRHIFRIGKQLSPATIVITALEKRNLKKSKKIISASERVKQDLVTRYGIPEEKIVVIPYGVNPMEFKPDRKKRLEVRKKYGIEEDEIVLIFVGWIVKRKGLKYLIKALQRVENAKLFIVGGRDLRPYKVLAKKTGVLDKIIFVGPVKKTADYYSASDIFVYPALYEPFGMAIMEAMASGLPVIVSRGAGAGELITDGHDGLLLWDPTDHEDIAKKINSLIADEELREEIGKNARKTAEKYSWGEIGRRTMEVYEEVAEKRLL